LSKVTIMVRAANLNRIDLAMAPRVVIVDPGQNGNSGHHAEVNRQLLAAGRAAGLAIECWVDQAFKAENPAFRPVFHGCGYEDPRHWIDLPGSLHLAARLQQQMRGHLSGQVHCWIAHSLLPFQLIGLARLLQHQPGARVEVGILYAPGERLGGSTDPGASSPGPQRERELAIANAGVAWSGLARATALANHRLRVGCSSRLQAALHAPLLAAAGLPPAQIQPAVVGAGWLPATATSRLKAPAGEQSPRVLLHWGDLKAGKGRDQVMAVVQALLAGGCPPLRAARWLFHHHSAEALSGTEQRLLDSAVETVPGFELWQGEVSRDGMLAALSSTTVALLPYCPSAYEERSSGVLWCYAAARLAVGLPARAVGYASGWLAEEASALGVGWMGLPTGSQPAAAWLDALDQALAMAAPVVSAYGRQVLGQSYGAWLLANLNFTD
jgi:hypothetical protein